MILRCRPAGVVHLGVVLQDLREFVPLAILARGDDGLGLLLRAAWRMTISASSSAMVLAAVARSTRAFFEVLLLLGVQVVVVLGDVGERLGQRLPAADRRASPRAAGRSSRSLRRLSDW